MDWIKRNLYFVIGGVVALALMGMAGYFLWSKYQLNNAEMAKLNEDYTLLGQLNTADPHPGAGQINNIKLAQEQEQQVRALIEKVREKFAPIPPIPNAPQVNDREFSAALSRTLQDLQKDATNSSVVIPPNYLFSFSAQNRRVTFAPGSLQPLSAQLGDVRAICDILFAAKVNSLDNIRRSRVSTDDNTGQLSDYTEKKLITNSLAILAPYEVSFRCFSPELAAVLAGFSSSSNGIVVKSINVELAPAPAAPDPSMVTMPVTPVWVQQQPVPQAETDAGARARFAARYGLGPRGPAPTPAPQPPQPVYVQPAAPPKPSQQVVLNERQLKVSLNLHVVRLIPKQQEPSQEQQPEPQPQPAQ